MPDESEQLPQADSNDVVVNCTQCNGAVQIPADALNTSITCPHCDQSFVASVRAEQDIIDDTEPQEEEEVPVEDHILDDNRINQLSALRRSLYRSRSFCIIGIIAGIVTAIQLVLYAIDVIRDKGPMGKAAGFGICAVASLIAAIFCMRKARAIQADVLALHHLDEPTTPPDFSTLSDGSQRWKNLEDMTRGRE